jgi:hypothetical protein
MAELFDVFEPTGALIGAIPLSAHMLRQLHGGQTVTIMFHTPRMLRDLMRPAAGSFEVTELKGKLVATNGEAVKQYIAMQAEIATSMKQAEKWSDPDAESNDPVR